MQTWQELGGATALLAFIVLLLAARYGVSRDAVTAEARREARRGSPSQER